MDRIISLLDQWKVQDEFSAEKESISLKIIEETELMLQSGNISGSDRSTWLEFLNRTKKPLFLNSLCSLGLRDRWMEVVFKLLQLTNFTLRDMMIQRVAEHPDRVLFRDMSAQVPVEWSYEQVYRHIREIAAVIYHTGSGNPRVALFCDNCVEGACADLACLCFDIFVTPLSIHFNHDILLHIFTTLQISVAITDSKERLELLQKVRQNSSMNFTISP